MKVYRYGVPAMTLALLPIVAALADPAIASARVAAPSPIVMASPDSGMSYARAMNRRGDVLGGVYDAAGQTHDGLWRRYDTFTALPAGRGTATAFNDRAHVVGEGGDAFLWRDGTTTALQYPSMRVEPVAINNRDQVVGDLEPTTSGPSQAFLWQVGEFTLLPTPDGMASHVIGVNDRGQVIGYLVDSSWSELRGVLWDGGAMTDLGSLGGGYVVPSVINNRGQIIGSSDLPAGLGSHPFLWENGRMVDLVPGGAEHSGSVSAINDAGVAVGRADQQPVLWYRGRMVRIGPPGYVGAALVVNDSGDIGGTIWPESGSPDGLEVRAFRWHAGRSTVLGPLEPVGVMIDLALVGIDDRGRLAATVGDGYGTHAVVWDTH